MINKQSGNISVFALVGIVVGFLLSMVLTGCSKPMTTPTEQPKPAVRTVGYDINIPDTATVVTLQHQYPNGVSMPPIEAQERWDYTHAYHGSPNVYYGPTAPGCEYVGVGIVVAPFNVASMLTFTSRDWSVMEAGYTYQWVGRFVVARIAALGTYVPDPHNNCR